MAFVIMRQRSLQDFFGGEIPDEPSMKEDEDYMEGDEFIFRNISLSASFPLQFGPVGHIKFRSSVL